MRSFVATLVSYVLLGVFATSAHMAVVPGAQLWQEDSVAKTLTLFDTQNTPHQYVGRLVSAHDEPILWASFEEEEDEFCFPEIEDDETNEEDSSLLNSSLFKDRFIACNGISRPTTLQKTYHKVPLYLLYLQIKVC